jgi:hypothetical protein
LAEVLVNEYDEPVHYVDGPVIVCCGAREANPSATCRGSSIQACVILEEKDMYRFRLRRSALKPSPVFAFVVRSRTIDNSKKQQTNGRGRKESRTDARMCAQTIG